MPKKKGNPFGYLTRKEEKIAAWDAAGDTSPKKKKKKKKKKMRKGTGGGVTGAGMGSALKGVKIE